MRCIVSTIQYGASVNKNLLRNLLLFADNHQVEKIYLFTMLGQDHDEDELPVFEDGRIEVMNLCKVGRKLNDNLKLFDTRILASQINPLTGFNFKLHRQFSYILPSPKIRYLSLPNTSKHPRFLATTGALTHGYYRDNAQGRKAGMQHQYGFAYVKIKSKRLFYYHPIEAAKNGNFNYAREFYQNGRVVEQQPEAMVLGDWHCGDTCPKTRKRTLSLLDDLQPKRVFFHDFFNGHSVNHHERANNLRRACAGDNLETEVNECRKELNYFAKRYPDIQFFIVESNHDLFLSRYIGEENFLRDGQNSVFSCKLFVEVMERGGSILEKAMRLTGEVANNVRFLREDEEYRVSGVGLDYHGHRGANGAKGTSASFDRYNLKLITGHEHTPKIYGNGMVVGTSTKLKLGYTKGASSWLNAHAILYKSGKYSLLTIIH